MRAAEGRGFGVVGEQVFSVAMCGSGERLGRRCGDTAAAVEEGLRRWAPERTGFSGGEFAGEGGETGGGFARRGDDRSGAVTEAREAGNSVQADSEISQGAHC